MEKQIDYLKKMTDDFGIIQFSNKNQPDIKSGYTLDDNTRALIVSSKLGLKKLSEIYFNFLKMSQRPDRRFINIFSGDKKPLEELGSQDSFGRTLWSLGGYLSNSEKAAEDIAYNSLKALENFPLEYPISESFALLGLSKMYELGFEKKKTKKLIEKISNSLISRINKHSDKNWVWPSNEMPYENARIPHAFFKIYKSLENPEYLKHAERLTEFLNKIVFRKKQGRLILNVIGNGNERTGNSWYKKGMPSPQKHDEQPVDTGAIVELHSKAYKIKNKNPYHLQRAEISFDWFNGRNRLNKKMISPEGGIYDGLGKKEVNTNQGAEALLSYMMAKIKFDEIIKNGISK